MTKHIDALDGLRGIAAVAVLLHHVGSMTHNSWLSPFGYLAVDLFFLLSGFVLANRYESDFAAGVSPWRYLWKTRVVRMYPMIVLGAVLGLCSAMIGARISPDPLGDTLRQLLLLPTFRGKDLFFLNVVIWSLMLEILINTFHAFLYPLLSDRVIKVVVVLSAFALVGVAWEHYDLNVGWSLETMIGGVVRVFFSFSGGVLIYRMHLAGSLPKLPVPFWISLALMVAILIVPLPTVSHHLPQLHDLLAAFIVFPLAIVTGLRAPLSTDMTKAARVSGQLSYPLYAIHFPLLNIAIYILGLSAMSVSLSLAFWVVVCLGLVTIAWIIDKRIERPVAKFMKSMF